MTKAAIIKDDEYTGCCGNMPQSGGFSLLALVSSSEFVEIASRRKRASKDILYGAAVKVLLCAYL